MRIGSAFAVAASTLLDQPANVTQLEGIRALLAASGLVAPDAFDRIVAGRPGVLSELVRVGGVGWPQLIDALSEGFSLPRVSPRLVRPKPMLIELVPFEVAARYGVLPVNFRTREGAPPMLWLALSDPTDREALDACCHGGAVHVRPMLAYPSDIGAALLPFYGRTPAPVAIQAPTPRPPPVAKRPTAAPPPPPPDTDREVEIADDDLEETPDSIPAVVTSVTPTPKTALPPVLVVVGGDEAFTKAAERAAGAAGMECVSADLFAAASLTRSLSPVAILVGDDAYAFDRVAFHKLAAEVGATLIVWDDLLDADEVLPVLAILSPSRTVATTASSAAVAATAQLLIAPC